MNPTRNPTTSAEVRKPAGQAVKTIRTDWTVGRADATQYGVPMATDATRLAGRYQLTERIGAGGMGEVWRATDDLLGRTVAIKLILPDLLDEPGFLRRFLAEARAMA